MAWLITEGIVRFLGRFRWVCWLGFVVFVMAAEQVKGWKFGRFLWLLGLGWWFGLVVVVAATWGRRLGMDLWPLIVGSWSWEWQDMWQITWSWEGQDMRSITWSWVGQDLWSIWLWSRMWVSSQAWWKADTACGSSVLSSGLV